MKTTHQLLHFSNIMISMILISVVPFPFCGDALAEESLWRTELRAGTSINSLDVTFNQFDIGLNRRLPWSWQLWETLKVDTSFTATVGVLEGGGDIGALGSSGLEFTFSRLSGRSPITIRAGSAVTLISEHRYGGENLGGPIQFTSHIGMHYQLVEHLNAVARYQHMSNASQYEDNPGIDMVMLELVLWF
jgi:hypothetical protein